MDVYANIKIRDFNKKIKNLKKNLKKIILQKKIFKNIKKTVFKKNSKNIFGN